MQRQQKLRLGDANANALRASWGRFTNHQRKQVTTLFADLIARAVRAAHEKEQQDDAAGK